ncbi:MAG: hypothetical protein HYT36_02710 [Candidatus Staskawiczbacteria bacterium]|nr:hypothetical protein [Candidatus Staskawiczbacteria bacterium]
MKQISDEQWKELEEFLNQVANEREEDPCGPGSYPSNNATSALKMLRKLGMERRKPSYIQ